MRKMARWVAITATLLLACFVRPAAGSPRTHEVHKPRASLLTVRYSPRARSSSPARRRRRRRVRRRHYRRHRRYRRRVRLPVRPTRERISQIQSALARKGFYQGDANGRWDSHTVDALRQFQSASHLQATGKLDALTLQKLGLGSDIAGVSPPKPVAPAKCCTSPPDAMTSSHASANSKASDKPPSSANATSQSKAQGSSEDTNRSAQK